MCVCMTNLHENNCNAHVLCLYRAQFGVMSEGTAIHQSIKVSLVQDPVCVYYKLSVITANMKLTGVGYPDVRLHH